MIDYESPIKMLCDEVRIKTENSIVESVQNVGIAVDKEEFVKALQYDRKQYGKGFEDGNKLYEKALDIACGEFATQTMFSKEEVKEIYINKAKRELEDNG